MMTSTSGSSACPCINTSSLVASVTNCEVANVNNTQLGFWVYDVHGGDTCYPLTYGSNSCKHHDISVNPLCFGDSPPEFCQQSFCFVDRDKCKDSYELVFKTDLLAFLEADLFYSYSTCNSTNSWIDFSSNQAVQGKFISVTIPEVMGPIHYKVDANHAYDYSETAYSDDSIPWEGWIIDYLDAVLEVSDIAGFNYTHRSGGSSVAVNGSIWTGAVYDVQTGLSCLAASMFWITTERLEMTSFTTPTSIDKIMLWIENPSTVSGGTLNENIGKVLRPFEPQLWFILLAAVLLVSIMGVWFSNQEGGRRNWFQKVRGDAWDNGTAYYRFCTLLSVFVDSYLASSINYFGGSVDFDIDSTLSNKILNFGFGFLVLIVCAAYTANLAAFLTILASGNYIGSMKEAIESSTPICGHLVLKTDLITVWPKANWIFNDKIVDPHDGMLENYDAGLCKGIVAALSDIRGSAQLMSKFCDRDLVYTSSLVLEKHLAFPACKDIATGISYWMYEADKQGVTFESFQERSQPSLQCSLLINQEIESDHMRALTPANFALPLLMLLFCSMIAAFIHVRSDRRIKKLAVGKNDTLQVSSDVANHNDTHESPETFNTSSSQCPQLFVQLLLPPLEDMTNSQTILKTLKNLQNYQNNLVELMIEREKEKKED